MNNSNIIKLIVVVVIMGGIGLFAVTNIRSSQPDNVNSVSQSNNTLDTSSQNNLASIKVGDIAPDFSFQTVEGQEVTLSSLKGQPVLFAFALATGCAACIIEAGNVREAQAQIPFKVIQLSISPYETSEDLLFFRKAYGSSDWLISFDEDERITKQYQVNAVDTTLIVDAQGKIIYRDDGIPAETKEIVNILNKSQK